MARNKDKDKGRSTTHRGATRTPSKAPKKSRKLGRRILLVLNKLVLLSVFAVTAYFAREYWLQWMSKPVSDVSVTGEFSYITRQQVAERISGAIGTGFLELDLEAIRNRLESDPWVDRAAIKRRWPSTLEVAVIEHKPIARWGNTDVLNHRGQIIHLPPDRTEEQQLQALPLLLGSDDMATTVMTQYQAMMQLLAPSGLAITELRLNETQSWSLKLGKVAVNIGRDRLMEKIGTLLLVYKRELKQHWQQVKSVDLRYESGIAVNWKESKSGDAKR